VDNPDTREINKQLLHGIYEPLDLMIKAEECTYGRLEEFISRTEREHHAIFPKDLHYQIDLLKTDITKTTTLIAGHSISKISTPKFYKYVVTNYNYLRKKLNMPYDSFDIYMQYTPAYNTKQLIKLIIKMAFALVLLALDTILWYTKSRILTDDGNKLFYFVSAFLIGYILAQGVAQARSK
jgi:hypothetical protein